MRSDVRLVWICIADCVCVFVSTYLCAMNGERTGRDANHSAGGVGGAVYLMEERDAVDELLHLARQAEVGHVADLRVGQHLEGAHRHRDALRQRGHVELVVERLLRLVVVEDLQSAG